MNALYVMMESLHKINNESKTKKHKVTPNAIKSNASLET